MAETIEVFKKPEAIVFAFVLFSVIIVGFWKVGLLRLFVEDLLGFLILHSSAIRNQVRVLEQERPFDIYGLVDFFAKSIAPSVALLSFLFALFEVARGTWVFTVFVFQFFSW